MIKLSRHKTPPRHFARVWPWLIAGLAVVPLALLWLAYYLIAIHDYNDLKPRLAQAVKEATGRELLLGGPLSLRISWHPRLVLEDIALGNPSWASRPRMASLRRAEIEVELWPLVWRRRLVVERLILEELDLGVESDASGRTNLDDLLPAQVHSPGAGRLEPNADASQEAGGLAWFRFRRIEIKETRLEWRRPGRDPWLARLKSLHLEQPQETAPTGVAILGRLGDQDFDLRGQVQAPAQSGRPWAVKAAWRQPGLELDLVGQVNDLLTGKGLDLALEAKVADLAAWAPKTLSGPWRLRGRLGDPRPSVYRLDGLHLNGPLGSLTGWAEVGLDAGRPGVRGQVASPALDLTPLWGPGQPTSPAHQAGASGGGRPPGKVFSAEPLPGLPALDLDLKLEAVAVRMPRLDLAEVSLGLRLNQGGLSLEPLKARLAGGPAHLRLTLTPQGAGQQAWLWLKLSQCQIGQVLRRAGAEEVISGEMEALVEGKGQGASLAAIMASLEGKAMAAVRRGRLHKRFLGLWGADLTGGLASALGELASGGESSLLHCLVLGLLAKNGQATTTALALDSQRLVLLGRGRLNLKTEELELAARPLPKAGLAAPGGLGLSLGNLARPFKLSGPLAHPHLTLDEREVLSTLGKTLGGLAALGPLGLAAALTSGGPSDSRLCQEAWAAASQGVPYEPKAGVTQPLERLGEELGGAVQRFLGR